MDKRKCEVCCMKNRDKLQIILSRHHIHVYIVLINFFVPNEDFATMSKYSLDSLENVEEDSLEKNILTNKDNDNDNNLEAIKSTDKFVKDTSFQLNTLNTKLTALRGIKGTKDVKLVSQNWI